MNIRTAFKQEPLFFHQLCTCASIEAASKRLQYHMNRNPHARFLMVRDVVRDRWVVGRVA